MKLVSVYIFVHYISIHIVYNSLQYIYIYIVCYIHESFLRIFIIANATIFKLIYLIWLNISKFSKLQPPSRIQIGYPFIFFRFHIGISDISTMKLS